MFFSHVYIRLSVELFADHHVTFARLEEFLRRRARLQRVEEEVRRRVVLGFFETLYWSRKFKRHMERKRAGRMTDIPRLDVPEILVDNEDEHEEAPTSGRAISQRIVSPSVAHMDPSDLLSTDDSRRTWAGAAADLSSFDTS